jgi:DNA invertase Pin-like site-specific DNA recombinase
LRRVSGLLIGYARVSTDAQDLTAQRDRPGLREALAACRAGDTLVVTKLDRLARSLPDARDIVDDLDRSSSTSASRCTIRPTL